MAQTFSNPAQKDVLCNISSNSFTGIFWPLPKLLFRDKRLRLYIYDIESGEKVALLSYCSYAQWVPGSDVVCAQNRNQLSIWYNINDIDRVNHIQIKGDVSGIERKDGKTEILVQEGSASTPYKVS